MISLRKMTGLTLRAADGEIGKLDNFYFDPQSWMVRFCIVQTGSAFSDRRVLVSPFAFDKPDFEAHVIPVHLEIEKIGNSTDVDSAKPLATEYSLGNVRECTVEGIDGTIGHADDFLVEIPGWNLRYIIVDTQNILPGRRVMIPIEKVKAIIIKEWKQQSRVLISLTKEEIKASPEFKPEDPMNPAYEEQVAARPETQPRNATEKKEWKVQESSEESFPASDAPSSY